MYMSKIDEPMNQFISINHTIIYDIQQEILVSGLLMVLSATTDTQILVKVTTVNTVIKYS